MSFPSASYLQPQPGHALFRGQVFLAFGENPAARALCFPAALVELFYLAVLVGQLVVVLADVCDNGFELLAGETRHGPVDEVEVVAAVKVIKNVHHRQPVPFDLRATADIDDPDLLCVHGLALGPRGIFQSDFTKDWPATAAQPVA
jgi:hypothetical protein